MAAPFTASRVYTPRAKLLTHTYPTAPTDAPTWAPMAPTVAPIAPTEAPTCAPIAPTWVPMAPTEAPTWAPMAPTELIMLVGKKLLVVEVPEPLVRGESVRGGPPLPLEWGPPDEPLSSEGVLWKSPVPKSTRWMGELGKHR